MPWSYLKIGVCKQLEASARSNADASLTYVSGYKQRVISQGERPRSGFTLVELISTCILLGVVFSISIPLMTTIARERRVAEQRQFAVQHAANLLERFGSKSWSELSAGSQEIPSPSGDLQDLLPGLERSVEVKELTEEPQSKQIVVQVRWKHRSGEYLSPVKLSAWVFSTELVSLTESVSPTDKENP